MVKMNAVRMSNCQSFDAPKREPATSLVIHIVRRWSGDESGSVLLEHAAVVIVAAVVVIVVMTIYAEPLYEAYTRIFTP
jgi:Flp pilus assembly pilin Flp